jgi:uncharacterized protein
LDPASLAQLRQLTSTLEWTWITGNHDPAISAVVGGRSLAEAHVDGLVLRHEASSDEPRPEFSGHYHPKLWLKVRGRSVSRRCFALRPPKLILPAFGAFTGGLDITDPALRAVCGGLPDAVVPTGDGLRRFPMADLLSETRA